MGSRERVDGKLHRHELGRIAGLGGVLQTQEPKRSRRARGGVATGCAPKPATGRSDRPRVKTEIFDESAFMEIMGC